MVGRALGARVGDRHRHGLAPAVAAAARKLLPFDALDLPARAARRPGDGLEKLVRGREGADLPEGVLVLGEGAVAAGALLGAVGGVVLSGRFGFERRKREANEFFPPSSEIFFALLTLEKKLENSRGSSPPGLRRSASRCRRSSR